MSIGSVTTPFKSIPEANFKIGVVRDTENV